MRIVIAAVGLLLGVHGAMAQTGSGSQQPSSANDPVRPVVVDTTGQMQPQGPTGPIETKPGGAPASSPQGETPAGMQAAPAGSSKTIVDTKP